MSPSSFSAFGATGPMVGYLYRVRIALLWVAAAVGRLPISDSNELSDDIESLAKWRETLSKRVGGIANGTTNRSALFAGMKCNTKLPEFHPIQSSKY